MSEIEARKEELQNSLTLWGSGESKQYMLDRVAQLTELQEGKE